MPNSKSDPKPSSQDKRPPEKLAEYSKPELEHLGSIRDLTRMPGGSVSTEGASGKGHRK